MATADPIAEIIGDERHATADHEDVWNGRPISSSSRRSTSASTGWASTFVGFVHVEDWVPQRLVTATGPNLLPRPI